MTSLKIHLNSVEKVKNFVQIISRLEGEFDLGSRRYVVDAKSIMGIFSLDLGHTLRLDIHDDAQVEDVKQELREFMVTEHEANS